MRYKFLHAVSRGGRALLIIVTLVGVTAGGAVLLWYTYVGFVGDAGQFTANIVVLGILSGFSSGVAVVVILEVGRSLNGYVRGLEEKGCIRKVHGRFGDRYKHINVSFIQEFLLTLRAILPVIIAGWFVIALSCVIYG